MSDKPPLVCICVPTYNAASTVRETLESILAQTYANLVVHVSDNASTDDTLKVIESISDQRITIHRQKENIGGEGNFNRCIQLATGKYTAIFHADDVYEPNMVAKQVAFLEANAKVGAVFTEASLIDDSGKMIGALGLPQGLVSVDCLYDFKTIFKFVLQYSNFLICPSAMARTEVYQQDIRSWRGEIFGTSADLDVWFRIFSGLERFGKSFQSPLRVRHGAGGTHVGKTHDLALKLTLPVSHHDLMIVPHGFDQIAGSDAPRHLDRRQSAGWRFRE